MLHGMSKDILSKQLTSDDKSIQDVLVQSSSKAVINAPIEKIDITEWVFNLSDAEYQSCSTAHFAGGTSTTSDGKRMSINAEMVGPGLILEHYVEVISEKHHCRLLSLSDVLAPQGKTTIRVQWEMIATPLTESTCELTNNVVTGATDDYLAFLEKNGIPFEPAKEAMQLALNAHNHEETPNFAKSIERKALSAN
jgi:hypothetical protein